MSRRRIRCCYFNSWASKLEEVPDYLRRVPTLDLRSCVSNPDDVGLLRKARLDCDWYAANARCFSAMRHPQIDFLKSWVVGKTGLLELAKVPREPGEERWLLTMAHQPQALGNVAGKLFAFLSGQGVKHLYYAFDEASRFMSCFPEIGPWLDVLIHDEFPLAAAGAERLRPGCRTIHRSWVANLEPHEAPFADEPEPRILFLGSQLGLTAHRKRQIDFLSERFGDRFVASCDHSVSVGDRAALGRFKVGFCPEGRKFTTPAMSATHTDRPFWSGCLGMVPVSEDSRDGGRLESLHAAGLIQRYPHGNLAELAAACERALAMSAADRRRIYDHFNQHETVGTVVAAALAATGG